MTFARFVAAVLVIGSYLTMLYAHEIGNYPLFWGCFVAGCAGYVWHVRER